VSLAADEDLALLGSPAVCPADPVGRSEPPVATVAPQGAQPEIPAHADDQGRGHQFTGRAPEGGPRADGQVALALLAAIPAAHAASRAVLHVPRLRFNRIHRAGNRPGHGNVLQQVAE